jgi:hypothetical protein
MNKKVKPRLETNAMTNAFSNVIAGLIDTTMVITAIHKRIRVARHKMKAFFICTNLL